MQHPWQRKYKAHLETQAHALKELMLTPPAPAPPRPKVEPKIVRILTKPSPPPPSPPPVHEPTARLSRVRGSFDVHFRETRAAPLPALRGAPTRAAVEALTPEVKCDGSGGGWRAGAWHDVKGLLAMVKGWCVAAESGCGLGGSGVCAAAASESAHSDADSDDDDDDGGSSDADRAVATVMRGCYVAVVLARELGDMTAGYASATIRVSAAAGPRARANLSINMS